MTITEDNLELALSKITIDSDAKADIFNAVNAGKVVTAHKAKISFNGWIGEGCVIVDPLTGAGGYIIAGGGNGGEVFLGLSAGLLQAFAFFFITNPLPAALFTAALLITGLVISLTGTHQQQLDLNGARFLGLLAGFGLSIILGQVVLISLAWPVLLRFIWLLLAVIRLLVIEIYSSFACNCERPKTFRERYLV